VRGDMRYLEDFHEGDVFELGEETIREQPGRAVQPARRAGASHPVVGHDRAAPPHL